MDCSAASFWQSQLLHLFITKCTQNTDVNEITRIRQEPVLYVHR
jgi:hypothetical protein